MSDPLSVPSLNRKISEHQEYLDTLPVPTPAWIRVISDAQLRKEQEINSKYHTAEEHEAAIQIQRTYRGHRERRHLDGITLDPSSRWLELIKEIRYRAATSPHKRAKPQSTITESLDGDGRAGSVHSLSTAQDNWRRIGRIAAHAGGGVRSSDEISPPPDSQCRQSKAAEPSSMLLDLRYFLEMIDVKHRYGANLQVYHERWERSPTDKTFFWWLDHGPALRLDLPGCTREKLDRERIRYLSKEERRDYLVKVDAEGKLRWEKNEERVSTTTDWKDSVHGIVEKADPTPAYEFDQVATKLSDVPSAQQSLSTENHSSGNHVTSEGGDSDRSLSDSEFATIHQVVVKDKTPRTYLKYMSPATILNKLLRATVKPGTWIYVCDTLGRLYVGIKSSGSFQHASFLSGVRISSAGSIAIENGQLVYLSPLSGHYRPTTKSFRSFVNNLKRQGVDLSKVKVSPAYAVLRGMEYYGKTKTGVNHILHRTHEEKNAPSLKHQVGEAGVVDRRRSSEHGLRVDGRPAHPAEEP